MVVEVRASSPPGGAAAKVVSERDATRGELGGLARVAARLARSASAVVRTAEEGAFAIEGVGDLPRLLREDLDLVRSLIEQHTEDARPVLVSEEDRRDSLHRLATLSNSMSAASVAIRNDAGELLGCLVLSGCPGSCVEEAVLDDVVEVARIAGHSFERIRRMEERERLEKSLQVQAAYLDHLFEDAPEAIAVLDERNRIVRVNRQYTRLYGYTAEDVIGRAPAELTVPPEGLAEAQELGRRTARGEQVRAEVVRLRKDGTRIHVALHCIPVMVGEDRLGLYTISRDLSSEVEVREAVERREERFRALIENATDMVAIVSPGGTIEYVTPSVETLLGYSPAELIGTNAFGLVHPDDAPDVIAGFTSLLRGEQVGEEYEFRLKASGERWRTFEVRARNCVDDPELRGVVVNARDVTDERTAKQMQRRLDAFLEATPDFVAVLDPHGRALSVNRSFRELLGIGGAESVTLNHLTLEDLFPGEVVERLLHEGIPDATREGSWSGETYLKNTSGTHIPVSQVVLAHRSASGKLEFLSTLARDITAQKEAETALRRSEAHFRSLIENALDIITIADPQGTVLFVSPSVKRVLGYDPEFLLGKNIFAFMNPEEVPNARERFEGIVQEDQRTGGLLELEFRHQNGSWRMLESVSHNLLHDPAVGAIVINSRDVTDRRRAEEALMESQQQLLQSQKMEAVGRLAGGIAHDFNNLLTAIKGFTELLLLDFESKDPRRAFASEIQGAATRAAGLTRQLLAFSRRQVLQPEVLDLNATVAEMEKMLRRLVGEDMRIACSLDPAVGRVKADPGQLEQVLMNLVVNARDAMPGGGEVRIRTANATLTERHTQRQPYIKPGEYVLLEVSDTGSGMSREILDRVFEPFFTTKEKGKGTGLGLSTVYGIVKQSDGYIWVDSEPGNGATFRIYLPRVEEQVRRREAEVVDPTSLEGSGTILVVEDELAVRVLVRRVLERNGYTVLDADSGKAAIALLDETSVVPDMLLTDVVMPGMSGRELADHLEARLPGVKVLYMSGYTDEAIVHHGVLDPGVAFLQKPFTPDVLLLKVKEVLGAPSPDQA